MLLLLDDGMATKASASAVMTRFRQADATLSFNLACPLWIHPEMHKPMNDFLRAVQRMQQENR
jgi:hypothetical protein